MRIIAGKYKGRRLEEVKTPGIRPTSDKVREAVFNILQNRIHGARVLDLFAGTGAMAVEALSRGADLAVLVEKDPKAADLAKRNVDLVGARDRARILRMDALGRLAHPALPPGGFDLVFLDPPYFEGAMEHALDNLAGAGLAGEDALVVAEHTVKTPLEFDSTAWVLEDQRRYGKTLVSLLSRVI
ncbi:MAG: 16S rRNA (guanine(966)-N(2))-methyltransferase RsmD [Desulfatibacillaceae bacterium]